jgi:monoterpene epsilon-lactone hydrolase
MTIMNLVRGYLGPLLAFAIAMPAMAEDFAPRDIPAKILPVPTTVSLSLQKLIAAPLSSGATPSSNEQWKALVRKSAESSAAQVPGLLDHFNVAREQSQIAGVNVYLFTPKTLPAENRNRLLVHVHGGAYVQFPGESGNPEAILMAGYAHMKVISIDYRMPPDHPYPAALDDAMAVWGSLVKTHSPQSMAIFGTSTGGGMTLAMILRAKADGLALPAAIAPGTPWSDLTKTGDSYFVNERVDDVLVTYDGVLGAAAKLYANGHDLKDPFLSPIYGDFHGFPPAILTTGTRDLFLSNTVRVHRKLKQAGVEAVLNVYEGQSHAQYALAADSPESAEAFTEIAAFFASHLAR